jgi:hypothetical protein
MKSMNNLFIILIFSLGFAEQISASSCCGGASAIPVLILGDEKAQMGLGLTQSKVSDYVDRDSLWQKASAKDQTDTVILNGSLVFQDRWQAGVSLPIVQRSVSDQKVSGIGDLTVNVGYEYLTDWDYNPWRPKGLGYLQISVPSGKSIYDTDSMGAVNGLGKGFWSFGLGTILSKNIGRLDGFANFEVRNSLERSQNDQNAIRKYKPGFGTITGLGLGYNFENLRVGAGLSFNYDDPINVSGDINSKGQSQQFVAASVAMNLALRSEWSIAINYSDQSVFGSPSNVALSKSLSVQLQKRWLR